jgi:hypothetical protein
MTEKTEEQPVETLVERSVEKAAKPKKHAVLDAMNTVKSLPSEPGYNPNAVANRFRPSGIEHHDYLGTRVRRWEIYQVDAVRVGLKNLGIEKLADIDSAAGDEKKMQVLTRYLTTCLVRPFKKSGVAQLFRRGEPGLARAIKDLRDSEVIQAMKTACELSRVFKE